MKKIALLLLACGTLSAAQAQLLTLSGSSYSQNFNGLAGGLPNGWHVFNFATATSVGVPYDTSSKVFLAPGSVTGWKSTTGGYKNFASANNATTFSPLGSDTAGQAAATDRALGIRQVGQTSTTFPGSDSGAAFVLTIANTTGLTAFNMSFKLQSLDSATGPRTTTWRVDYGLGAIPTSFTAATASGTLTTGGNTYSNNTVTVSFGSALNNQAGPVWIRIVEISGTTGSGNRTSSAIDDVSLTWTGSAAGSPRPNIVGLTPVPFSTVAPTLSALSITFDKAVTKGSTGNIYIKDRNAGTTQTIASSSASVTVSGRTATITGFTLQSNKVYHVTFDSTAFDSSGYRSTGIYDTTIWRFNTNNSGIAGTQHVSLPLTIVNPTGNGDFTILCTLPNAAVLTAVVYDLAGREVARNDYNAQKGDNRLKLHTSLPAGEYLIRVSDGAAWSSVKVMMR